MSQIFDALQRSESERTESKPFPAEASTFVVATELLEAAERKRRGVDAPSVVRPDHEPVLEQFRSLPVSIPPNSRLVSVGEQESLGAEKFRFLAVRLRQMRQNRTLHKILITSTIRRKARARSRPTWLAPWPAGSSIKRCCWKATCGGRRWLRSLGWARFRV